MKFVRINEYTVNCILTADDLEEQGIRIEDLLKKEESSMEFLHGIIERATEEVGFHPDGNVLPMQITMLPDDSISLTLTENPSKMIGNFIEGFTGALKKLVSSIEQGKKASESESKEEGNRTAVADQKAESRKMTVLKMVFSFKQLSDVLKLAAVVREYPRESSLFADRKKGRYLLLIGQEIDKEESTISPIFLHAGEYGDFVSADERFMEHMRETCDCIVPRDAIKRLHLLGKAV